LAITSPTSGGHSVGIVRSRTQTIEFSFVCFFIIKSSDPAPCLHITSDFSITQKLSISFCRKSKSFPVSLLTALRQRACPLQFGEPRRLTRYSVWLDDGKVRVRVPVRSVIFSRYLPDRFWGPANLSTRWVT
jgi:hypothetical protein